MDSNEQFKLIKDYQQLKNTKDELILKLQRTENQF